MSASTSGRSEEHTSELQSQSNLVCRLLLEKKNIALSAAAICFGEMLGLGAGADYHDAPLADVLLLTGAGFSILSPMASLASTILILKICFEQKRLVWWAIPAVLLSLMFFFSIIRRPPISTLFPYTALFR